jgi:anti-anti-sigma factor
MEITTRRAGEILELCVSGRLDAYWADHLSTALEDALRGGADHIQLNLADVSFMSSVGIRVLLTFYKQLQRINGTLTVSNPSEAVKTVLELTGLDALLGGAGAVAAAAPRAAARGLERPGISFEIFEVSPDASLHCTVVGTPELLEGCRFAAEHCRTMRFPDETFAVGLGAFGHEFADCQRRFGEFVAASGAAAYLPTDGSNVPDYLVSSGALVPELKVLYGLVCAGSFAQLARFEGKEGAGPVGLAALADAGLQIAACDTAGIVMVAESAGLVGAALRRSPALEPSAAAPFGYPQIREWLSFTPERAYPRSLALVVGVATRAERPPLTPLLRPMSAQPWPAGHFHAAAFSYRPLQKGVINLQRTVSTLFEAETLQGVLHLLSDSRDIVGTGDSEFVRGACWIAPITEIVADRG